MANDIVRKKRYSAIYRLALMFFGLYSIPSFSLTSSIE